MGRSDGHSLDPLRMRKHLHKHTEAGLAFQLCKKEQKPAYPHGNSWFGVMEKLGESFACRCCLCRALSNLLGWTSSQPWVCVAKTTLGIYFVQKYSWDKPRKILTPARREVAELGFQNGSCQLNRMIYQVSFLVLGWKTLAEIIHRGIECNFFLQKTVFAGFTTSGSCAEGLHPPLCHLFPELETIWEAAFASAIHGARLRRNPIGCAKSWEKAPQGYKKQRLQ